IPGGAGGGGQTIELRHRGGCGVSQQGVLRRQTRRRSCCCGAGKQAQRPPHLPSGGVGATDLFLFPSSPRQGALLLTKSNEAPPQTDGHVEWISAYRCSPIHGGTRDMTAT